MSVGHHLRQVIQYERIEVLRQTVGVVTHQKR